MSAEDGIPQAVEEVWKKYDLDGNGVLDKKEMRNFVKDTLCELG